MTPGSNIPLPVTRVTVDVTAPVRLDVSGLLLTADGKVRSDDDFVFYNQPQGPGVTHRAAAGGTPDAIAVDTAAVPAAIDKVVVTASLDAPNATFAGTEPTATVRDTDSGAVVATFTPPRLGTETALVVVELYRRAGAWKLRAVGQGYADGLAGIATDFGVTVEEEAGTPGAPEAPTPGAPVPGQAATPVPGRPVAAPGAPLPGAVPPGMPAEVAPGGQFDPHSYPPHPEGYAPMPPAPGAPGTAPFGATGGSTPVPGAPGYGDRAPAPGAAPGTPPFGTSNPPAAAPGSPVPAFGAQPSAPGPAAPAFGAPGKVNLDKGRVSLQKNQTVSLVKGGRPLTQSVRMGLGWEPAYKGRDIDLDASVIAYGPDRNPIDACYFGKLMILGGAVQHSGDNLTGEGAGDDESITVHLGGLPPEVTGLVFTVSSFNGQKFTEVAKAYCRLLDGRTGEELVRFDLTGSEPKTGVLMCKFIRQYSGEWEMTAVGEYVKSRTVRDLIKPGAMAL
ncbi:TerD family protein [Streptomyces gamaensis]|uniref:TerD family protein n=1 Tax=Streptomyces gamaensis TaxID=1763542 RepID=A0ABW0Z0Z9_9ACTN